MKRYYILFFFFLILIIVFFTAYKLLYDQYLNKRINNKCYKKNLLPPYKLFKYSVSTVGILLIALVSATFINLNNTHFFHKKYDKVVITELISNKEKLLFNYEIYDLKINDNQYCFKVDNDDKFKTYLNSFDSFYQINNKYYVQIEGDFYLFEYEIKDNLSDYILTPLYISISNDLNNKDFLPAFPCEGTLNINCNDSSLFEFLPLINITWEEFKLIYSDLNPDVIFDDEKQIIIINNESLIEKYVLTFTEESIYLKIGEKSYTITYDLQGGIYNGDTGTVVKNYYNSNPELIVPTKENYKFLGWYRSLCSDYDSKIVDNYNYSKDIILFAKWESINNIKSKCYNVKFVYNHNNLGTYNFITYTNKILKLPNESIDFIYEFHGWYTDLNDESTRFTEDTIITSDLTVYAKILPRSKVTITLQSGDGSFYDNTLKKYVKKLNVEIYKESSNLGHIDIYEPLGYGFSCWYIDGKPLPNNYVFTDDVTLTAHYEKNTYKITFITYTEEELEPIEFLYDQKIKLDYKLERDGYKFVKWDILDEYKNMPAYDLVATAIWRSDDGVNYVLNEDKTGYIVYGLYDEEISDLIIKDKFLGLPVISINEFAFSENQNLKTVVIPDTITIIGRGAFSNCCNLEKVIMSKNLQTIEGYAFSKTTALKEITIPKNVSVVGDCVFQFSGVENIIIENGVTTLGSQMFSDCVNLKKITIPSTITNVYFHVFENSGLEEIYFEEGLETISFGMFEGCKKLKTIQLPESIKKIGDYAFNGTSITTINIPGSLEYIGKGAFSNQTNFVNIELPNTVKYIGEYAFANCTNLISIKLSDELETIDYGAFYNCTSLTDIVLPEGLTLIGENAFLNCDKLTKINIPDSVKEIKPNAMPKNMLYTVVDNLLTIDKWVFGVYDKTRTKYIVDEKFNGIASESFVNCKKAAEIFICCNVKYIGALAFWQVPYDCKIYIESKFAEITVEEDWNLIDIQLKYNSYFQNVYIYPTFGIDIIINRN